VIAWAALTKGRVEHAFDITDPGRPRYRSLCGKWRHRSELDFANRRPKRCATCSKLARPKGRWDW